MPKSREWLGKAFFESLLIVFSILLALWVNGLKEERDHRAVARQALANFEREILRNKAHVEERLPYHRRLKESLLKVQQSRERVLTLDELWQKIQFQGVNTPLLLDTAWQTALATQALSYLDYDTVAALSGVYGAQRGFGGRAVD